MQSLRYKAGGRAFAHIAQFHPELTALRRDLHAHPELGFEEIYTGNRVKEALKVCGVDEIHDGIGASHRHREALLDPSQIILHRGHRYLQRAGSALGGVHLRTAGILIG